MIVAVSSINPHLHPNQLNLEMQPAAREPLAVPSASSGADNLVDNETGDFEGGSQDGIEAGTGKGE